MRISRIIKRLNIRGRFSSNEKFHAKAAKQKAQRSQSCGLFYFFAYLADSLRPLREKNVLFKFVVKQKV